MKKKRHTNKSKHKKIFLRDLLDLHDNHLSETCLKDYFCDGYFMTVNPVLRHIRESILKLGFRFSSSEPKEYFSWPLLGLDSVLSTKTIPYHDTVTVLRKLESRLPGRMSVDDLTPIFRDPSSIQQSPFLHESIHCIGVSLYDKILGSGMRPSKMGSKEFLFELLLGEAMANTGETFVNFFHTDSLHQFLLIKFFSQAGCSPQILEHFRYFASKFDQNFVIRMLVFSFLYYNFLYVKFGHKEAKQLVSLLKPTQTVSIKDEKKIIEIVKNQTFKYSQGAAVYTSHYYTQLMGMLPYGSAEDYVKKVTSLDFVKIYSSNPKYQEVITTFADILDRGLRSQFFDGSKSQKKAA